ncbi:complement factor H-related protein 1-like isoform X2 [Salvelinus alpinus]|uniref:complement factor H-related protein 1-like isoform X2 n=1 Tax=Salvelinus alpinus TaxID=8036 RepID=UPI0039FD49FF
MFYSFHFYCIYHLLNMKSSLTLLCLVVWVNVDASSAQTELIRCYAPDIANGAVIGPSKEYYNEDDVLRYSCNTKFVMSQRRLPQCTKMGNRANWSPTPECEELKCTLSLPPTRGTSYTPADRNLFLPDERVTVTCTSGFWNSFSRQTENTITCKEDGQWSSSTDCERITCGDPRDPLVSSPYRWQRGQLSETQRYNCKTGFKTTNARGVATCISDGSWTPEPLCEEIEGACINPTVMNGFIVQSNERNVHPRNSKIHYSCNVGFKPSTGGWWGEATCTEGTWSGISECIAQGVQCDPPPKVENAIVEIPYQNTYIDGFEVNYECRKSFEIEGLKKLTCENGSWTTPPPTCKPSCPDPPRITNGDFTMENRDVEDVITEVSYQCSRQYTLSFTGSIRCQNGKWPRPPKCLRPCEISTFDAEYNLQNLAKKENIAHGEKKTLHCKEGYYHEYKQIGWNIKKIEVKCDDGAIQYGEHIPICSHRYS